MNKSKILFNNRFSILRLLVVIPFILLISCQNPILKDNFSCSIQIKNIDVKSKPSKKADERSILPDFSSYDIANFTSYQFTYAYTEDEIQTNPSVSFDTLELLNLMLKETTFTSNTVYLKILAQDNVLNQYYDVKKVTLSEGQNDVSFELVPLSGKGNLLYTIEYSNDVNHYKYVLTNIADNSVIEDTGDLQSNSAKTFSLVINDINHGQYKLEVSFYATSDETEILNKLVTIVHIAPGITSTATAKDDKAIKINSWYNIQFVPNEGTLVSGQTLPTIYTSKKGLPSLPSFERTGYVFGGWYENSDFSGSKIDSIPAGTKEDKILYAQWILNSTTYYVSQSGSDISGTGTQTDPCKTIKGAITKISLLNLTSSDFTVLVDGTLTGQQEIPYTFNGRSITISGVTGNTTDILDANGADSATTLSIYTSCSVTIRNLKITGGTQSGIYVYMNGNLTLGENCLVTDNSSSNNGGGINTSSSTSITLMSNASITKNTASNGGAIFLSNGGNLDLQDDALITANTATVHGSAVCLYKSSISLGEDAQITNSTTAPQDIYFSTNEEYIFISSDLTNDQAPITLCSYNTEVGYVLEANDDATIAANYNKFSITQPADDTTYQWLISNTGALTARPYCLSVYVGADGDDSNDGLTEDAAVPTLSKALYILNNLSETYDAYAIIINGEVSCQEAEINITNSNITALTIQGKTNADTDSLTGNDSYRVLTINTTIPVTLKNLKVCNGFSDGSNGAGIYSQNFTTITLDSCIISDNVVNNSSGAGIYLIGDTSGTNEYYLDIENTSINNNTIKHTDSIGSYSGAGLMIVNSKVNVTISGNSNISQNIIDSTTAAADTPSDTGAGIFLGNKAITVIKDSVTFSENEFLTDTSKATNTCGGGLYLHGGKLTIQDNVSFDFNSANNGGAIYIGYNEIPTVYICGNTSFTNNIASLNGSSEEGKGGAIYVDEQIPSLFIYGNVSIGQNTDDSISNTADEGGGIYNAGNTYIGMSSTSTFSEFTGFISHNQASTGGGIKNLYNLEIHSGTISANTATYSGGGIYQYQGSYVPTLTITGGTIDSNTCGTSGNGSGLYFEHGDCLLSGTALFTNNEIYLQNGIKITVNEIFPSGTEIVATIVPYTYSENPQVLTGDAVSTEYTHFDLMDSDYKIDSDGKVQSN